MSDVSAKYHFKSEKVTWVFLSLFGLFSQFRNNFVTFPQNHLYLTIPTNPKSIIFTLNDKNIIMVMHVIVAKVIIVFLFSGNGFIF